MFTPWWMLGICCTKYFILLPSSPSKVHNLISSRQITASHAGSHPKSGTVTFLTHTDQLISIFCVKSPHPMQDPSPKITSSHTFLTHMDQRCRTAAGTAAWPVSLVSQGQPDLHQICSSSGRRSARPVRHSGSG